MNSNNINDIYIDEEKRIWIANYPEGITIIDNRYKSYNWIKHSIGNRQSLVNDQVHSVIEDSDGCFCEYRISYTYIFMQYIQISLVIMNSYR